MSTSYQKFQVKNTGKYGKGVFATMHIKAGEHVHVLDGKTLTLNELVKAVLTGKEAMNDPLQVGRRTYIDLNKISRMFNHSCNPNAGVRKRSELFAIRDIQKGEEITYDYSQTISPTQWDMVCTCGTENCRKTIHDIRSISKKQLQFYKKVGAIQKYMKPLLPLIETGNYVIPKYEKNALKRLGYKDEGG